MRHQLLPLLGVLVLETACSAPQIAEPEEQQGPWIALPENAREFSCDALETKPTFCDDFDRESVVEKWDDLGTFPDQDQGSIDTSSDDAVSEPNALVATLHGPFPEGTDYVAALVQKRFRTFEDVPFRARVRFAMKVNDFDGADGARIIAFQFLMGDESANYNQLVFDIDSQGASLSSQFTENIGGENFDTRAGDPESGPALNEWTQVDFELEVRDPSGQGNTARLSVGDKVLFDRELHQALFGGVPRFELGLPWVNPETATADWRIRYDNVLVEIQPLDDLASPVAERVSSSP